MREGTYPLARYYWIIDGTPREVQYGGHLGPYATFTDPLGGGMVVIERSLDGESPPGFRYMEITRMGLATLTYYGTSDSFNP